MQGNKKLTQELITLDNLRNVVSTYQEIAAMRMKRVKTSVLNSRRFTEDLNTTFKKVSYAYQIYVDRVKRYKHYNADLLGKNGRTIVVFLSANMGLYGEILRKTSQMFLSDLRSGIYGTNTDIVIVGRVGRDTLANSGLQNPYKYFDLSDGGNDPINMSKLLEHVLAYTKIVVYHGIFKNVLSQIPTKTFITGDVLTLEREYEGEGNIMFLFEPSVEKIAEYFENQVLSSVFEQVTYESNLSKFASRMVTLYSASQNIEKSIHNTDYAMKKYTHRLFNSKQLALLSGLNSRVMYV